MRSILVAWALSGAVMAAASGLEVTTVSAGGSIRGRSLLAENAKGEVMPAPPPTGAEEHTPPPMHMPQDAAAPSSDSKHTSMPKDGEQGMQGTPGPMSDGKPPKPLAAEAPMSDDKQALPTGSTDAPTPGSKSKDMPPAAMSGGHGAPAPGPGPIDGEKEHSANAHGPMSASNTPPKSITAEAPMSAGRRGGAMHDLEELFPAEAGMYGGYGGYGNYGNDGARMHGSDGGEKGRESGEAPKGGRRMGGDDMMHEKPAMGEDLAAAPVHGKSPKDGDSAELPMPRMGASAAAPMPPQKGKPAAGTSE